MYSKKKPNKLKISIIFISQYKLLYSSEEKWLYFFILFIFFKTFVIIEKIFMTFFLKADDTCNCIISCNRTTNPRIPTVNAGKLPKHT